MKGYKGFDKDFKCRGKQYAENTVFEEPNAELCKSGMHFCENPIDVLEYYGFVDDDANLNEFAEVEALGDVKTEGNKSCTNKLKVGAKLGIMGFVKAFVDLTIERVKNTEANTGDMSAATNTGNMSAATNTGYRSAAVVEGAESIAMAIGYQSRAKGALGCWIVLAEWSDDGAHIITVKSHRVDGKTIKPDKFYMLRGGRFVLAEGEKNG